MQLTALFPPWLSHVPIDWIVIIAVLLLLTFDAMRSGSGRASVIAVTFPIAAFLSSLLPLTTILGSFIGLSKAPIVQAGIFLAIFLVVFVLMHRIVFNLAGISRGLLFSFLSSISATVIMSVMWMQVPALSALFKLNTPLPAIFGAPYALFWIIGAYLILAFVRS
jgi:hypothetical protein